MKRALLSLAALALQLGCAASEPAPVTPSAPAKAAPAAKTAPVPETTVDLAKGTAKPAAGAPDGQEEAEGTRRTGEEGTPQDQLSDKNKQTAKEFGLIGLLKAPEGDAANGSIFGKDGEPVDPKSVKGTLWGDSIGESFGAGGLGLVGTGGGGTGEGTIGLGSIGTIGHGAGTGTSQGFGSGSGRLGGAKTPATQVTVGAATVGPALDADIVKRQVRRNINRMRYCYEKGLASKPTLAGKINVKFAITKDGKVTGAASSSSDLPDKDVVACVVKAFAGLEFPAPANGATVVVTYPIAFQPGDGTTPPATPPTTAKAADPLSSAQPATKPATSAATQPAAPASTPTAPAKKP